MRRARIQADGTLAAWLDAPSLPTPLHSHAAVAWRRNTLCDRRVGWESSTSGGATRSDIATDGSLSTWQRDRDFPVGIVLHAAVVTDGRIYVSGGDTTGGKTNRVYVAMIGTGGALGSWQQTTALPPSSLYRHAMTATDDTIYVTGGYDGSAVRNEDVHGAQSTPTARWAPGRPQPCRRRASITRRSIHDGRLVLLGGRNSTALAGLVQVDSVVINAERQPCPVVGN